MRQTPIYDVCVIGSGAAGGVIAKELCEGGAKVIMLEAGREVPLGKFTNFLTEGCAVRSRRLSTREVCQLRFAMRTAIRLVSTGSAS